MFFENTVITKLLYCSKIYTKPAETLSNNGRHAHALVYFIDGNSDYIYDNKLYSASAGSVLFLPKDKPYLIERHSVAECIYIDFYAESDEPLSPFVRNYPNTAHFRDVFSNILSLYKQKRIGYESEMMSLVYKIISMIQIADRTAYLPNIKYRKISDAVDFINKNYTSGDIKISTLAKMSRVSPRYFGELFSVFFGVSPKEYIIRMQLDTAKNLLISSSEKISDIAEACGFGDVYYFSKIFKKSTGKTPSEFRKDNNVL